MATPHMPATFAIPISKPVANAIPIRFAALTTVMLNWVVAMAVVVSIQHALKNPRAKPWGFLMHKYVPLRLCNDHLGGFYGRYLKEAQGPVADVATGVGWLWAKQAPVVAYVRF